VNTTTQRPISIFPTKVYLVLEENGVIIAHPGIKSFAFFSTTQSNSDSFVIFLYNECWFLAVNILHLHPSLDNFKFFQLFHIKICLFLFIKIFIKDKSK